MDKSLVNQAIVDNDRAPPGYLYQEIAKMTHADVTICEKLADYIIKQLRKKEKNANVQYKVLMVIKHVSKMARPEFKRMLQRQSNVIKERTQFRGPIDPLRGDALNKRVRDAASEAVQAIFDTSQSSLPGMTTGRMQGIGSDARSTRQPNSAGNFAMSSSSTASQSYGSQNNIGSTFDSNDALHQPPISSGTMQSVGNYNPRSDKQSNILSKLKSAFTTNPTLPKSTGVPGYNFASNRGPNAVTPGSMSFHPPDALTVGATNNDGNENVGGPTSRARGEVGGVWGSAVPTGFAGAPTSSFGRSQTLAQQHVSVTGQAGAGNAKSDGSYERRLVEDVTAAAGVRPIPDPAKLQSFLSAARGLDPALLVKLFDERLQSESHHIVQKALAVITAMANTDGFNGHKKQFADHCDEILALYDEADKPAVRKQAAKTLHALGVNYSGGHHALAEGASNSQQVNATLSQTADSRAVNNPSSDLSDLFGGMAVQNSQQSTAPAAPEATEDSLFGGLSFAGASSTEYDTSQQQTQPLPQNEDPFGTLNFSATEKPPVSSFSFSALKSTEGNNSLSNSGFSFAVAPTNTRHAPNFSDMMGSTPDQQSTALDFSGLQLRNTPDMKTQTTPITSLSKPSPQKDDIFGFVADELNK